jgi:predicted nuclease with RNAse H fold
MDLPAQIHPTAASAEHGELGRFPGDQIIHVVEVSIDRVAVAAGLAVVAFTHITIAVVGASIRDVNAVLVRLTAKIAGGAPSSDLHLN